MARSKSSNAAPAPATTTAAAASNNVTAATKVLAPHTKLLRRVAVAALQIKEMTIARNVMMRALTNSIVQSAYTNIMSQYEPETGVIDPALAELVAEELGKFLHETSDAYANEADSRNLAASLRVRLVTGMSPEPYNPGPMPRIASLNKKKGARTGRKKTAEDAEEAAA